MQNYGTAGVRIFELSSLPGAGKTTHVHLWRYHCLFEDMLSCEIGNSQSLAPRRGIQSCPFSMDFPLTAVGVHLWVGLFCVLLPLSQIPLTWSCEPVRLPGQGRSNSRFRYFSDRASHTPDSLLTIPFFPVDLGWKAPMICGESCLRRREHDFQQWTAARCEYGTSILLVNSPGLKHSSHP